MALTGLVEAVAAAGDHDRAEQIARSITDPDSQAEALTGLVEAVAAAGDHDRAEQIARSITNPDSQARTLTELACQAPVARSRTLGVAALAIGRWTTPLIAVGGLDPRTLSAFVDECILRPRMDNGLLSDVAASAS